MYSTLSGRADGRDFEPSPDREVRSGAMSDTDGFRRVRKHKIFLEYLAKAILNDAASTEPAGLNCLNDTHRQILNQYATS